MELYFLSQVITASFKETLPSNQNIPIKLFDTPAKCIHFVIMVLEAIADIIQKLDSATMRHFIENGKVQLILWSIHINYKLVL